jgi:transcriptional regulator with GAF, ATPase, and Fis domain
MDKYKSNSGRNVLERCGADCEKAVIIHALTRTKGNQSIAAKILGITARTLAYRVHKYSIDCEQFRCG